MESITLKSGKVWPLNTAYEGDCLEFMRELPDGCIDVTITDPPYFKGPEKKEYYGERTSSVTERGKFKDKEWDIPTYEHFNEIRRISKKYIIFGCNYFEFGSETSGRIIWDKVNGESSFSDCEIAMTDIFQHVRQIEYMWNGMLQGDSIVNGRIPRGNKSKNEKRIHQTQKPLILIKHIIEKWTEPGHLIGDFYLGSFSVPIACKKLKRDWVGSEKDSGAFSEGLERYETSCLQHMMEF